MGWSSMLLFANALTLCLSTAEGRVKSCNFLKIKNGVLFNEKIRRPYFPAPIGKWFHYYCNRGFVTPSGSYLENIRCTVQGWEPAVPCLRQCGSHYIENGELLQQKENYVQDQSVKVQCYPGYSLPNGQDTVICTENGWSPQPKCIPVKTCSKADIEIENGFFSESVITYALNKTTQYRCKQGYVTANGETSEPITCLQNGWSAQPSCIKSCDRPIFENAGTKNNSTWFKVNDKLDYECHAGYENNHKDTKGSITCHYDGWSDKPSCYERECSIPLLERHLVVYPKKEKYKVGDLLKFSCRPGHRVGPDSVQCYHFGWSPSFPRCKVGQVGSCDQPPELLNGEVKGTKKEEYRHGEVVEYDCKPRFLLKGPNKIQCVDGKWTTLPICVEEKRTCGDVPELEHGSVQLSIPPYHHGDSLEFTCLETFTMIGSGSVSCTSGRWTQLPRCVATDQLEKCKAPRLTTVGAKLRGKSEFDHNFRMSYKCRGKQNYEHSICINGRWDPEPNCTRVEKESCPPPPQIPNAQVMETTVKYWDGEKVSVLCQDNYLAQDTEEMVCRDGRWQSLPRCVAKIPCSQPPEIDYGSIILPRSSEERRDTVESRSYEHGTTLSYVCDDGFRMVEEHGVTCHTGKWSAPPRCIGLPCGPPPSIRHGIVSHKLDSYQHGEEVAYSCAEGFGIDGSAFIKCVGGKWSHPPACIRTDCDNLPRFENAILIEEEKNSYRSGEQVTFKCAPSYQMDGSNIVTCVNSKWIGEPVCKEISCTPPEIENGNGISNKHIYKENERYQYKCNRGFQFRERGDAVCTASGWNPQPSCEEMTCKPPYIPNGSYSPQRIKHRTDDEIRYSCKEGFYPATRETVVKCTSTGWIPAPRCSLKPCDFPQIKHGGLYQEWRHRPYFPVPIGKEYEYYCNNGFLTPSGTYWDYIRCTVQGWEPKVPCRRQCGFQYVENGDYLQWKGKYVQDQSVKVKCYSGYSLPNGQDTVTCTENGWSPQPKCIRVKTCSKADIEIENGFLSESDLTYDLNRKTQYRCKQGYVTSNGETSGTIACLQEGWSAQPSCIKSCDRPIFENAGTKNNSTWFKLNDKLDYECHDGFENKHKDTKGSITCEYDGWSDKPSCYERECSIPLVGTNLIVNPRNDKYKVGDLLKFSCRQGHRVGSDSVQCYHFGWSPDFPKCKKGQVESCDQPPELHNGEVKGIKKEEYGHGEVVEYDCKPRFLLKGPNKIQCVDGNWTTLPICVEEERTCGDIPKLEHGSVQFFVPPYHHGDSVEFNCTENFTMIGLGSVSCFSGRWTKLPQCVAMDQLEKCKALKPIDVETIQPNKNEFNHNVNMSYKCKGEQEYKHSVCINGRWDPEPICEKAEKESCPPPPQIPNAQVMETTVKYRDGEKVSVLCQDNYLTQDTEEMVCRNGRWQSLPHCIAKIPCSQPPEIDHGSIKLPRSSEERRDTVDSRSYEHGTTLSYVCDDGFRMAEEHGVTCSMGKWSVPPCCIGLPCGPPPSIHHGIVSHELDSYQHGEEVIYSCAEGFGIDGPAFIKCVGGKWSQPPACIRTGCDSIPRFDNAILTEEEKNSYRSGEQVTFKCAPSFHMNGSNIVTCVNRKWIGELVCKDNSCVDPPHVENATIVTRPMIKYPSGERVRYECKKPFELFGEVEVMCQYGVWTEPPKCKDSTGKCGLPPPIDNGDITSFPLPVYAPLSSVEYQCQSLYRLQGNKKITCRNGEWTNPPKCLQPCVISEEIMERHNITLRWIENQKLYSPSGDFVEFQCKYGYKQTKTRTPLRAKCVDGHINYPTCSKKYSWLSG